MNDGFKQRIVGAILLLVIAVLFLPMLFDFSGIHRVDKTPRIPEPAEITPVEFERSKRPDNMRHSIPADQIYQPDNSDTQDRGDQLELDSSIESFPPKIQSQTPAPGLSNSGLLAGWVLQVGAFKEFKRADKLVESLLKDGYKAYQMENRNRGLFFVYVGPEVDKKSLLQMQKEIDGKYRVESKIFAFDA